jgi:hypothetical protein
VGLVILAMVVYKLQDKVFGAKEFCTKVRFVPVRQIRRFVLSTPGGTSPYATSTPVIDSVTRTPSPTPVPIPGLIPLSFPSFMAQPAPAPYLGVPPVGFPPAPAPYLGVPPVGINPAAAPFLGMPPMGFGVPWLGIPPAPVPYLGVQPLGFPQTPAPYLGVQPLGFPQTPAPYLGVQPLGIDMQMTPWPVGGLGGQHAISPVTAMLVSQLGLREAVSRIGDAALKQRVTDNINEAIDRTIESVSGMTLHPWFGTGEQFMTYPIAAQLALIAARYPEGALKDALLTIAGQIVQKSIAPTGEGTGRRK